MSSSIDHRILQLLEEQGEPTTASFIGFVLSEFPFEEISDSLNSLWQSGYITLDAYGYSICQLGSESLLKSEEQRTDDKIQEAGSHGQGQEQQIAELPYTLPEKESHGEEEARLSPKAEDLTLRTGNIAFSNILSLDNRLRLFLHSSLSESAFLETIEQSDSPQLSQPDEITPIETVESYSPASATEGDAPQSPTDTSQVDLVDYSCHEPANQSSIPQADPASSCEGVVTALTQDSLDEDLEVFSGTPSLEAPAKSFRDDANPLHVKLSDASIGDVSDWHADEVSVGVPQEVTDAVSAEYLKMLEDYSSPEDHSSSQIHVQAHSTSQVQDEYQALIDMLFAESIKDDSTEESEEPNKKRTQEAENEEVTPQEPNFTCWTLVSALGLSSRPASILTRESVSTVRDLIKIYDSLYRERGMGAVSLREIGEVLVHHSSDMPAVMDVNQIRSLCNVSGSTKYVFDIFGYLRRVTLTGYVSHMANGDVRVSSDSEGLPDTTQQIDELPITTLTLPNRLLDALLKAGYTTIGEVSNLTEAELLSMRGVGARAVFQLQEALDALAVKALSNDTDILPAPSAAPFAQLKDDQTPISDLGLPNRLTNALRHAGYRTVGEIADLPDEKVLSFRGVGVLAVEQLHQALDNLSKEHASEPDTSPAVSEVDTVEDSTPYGEPLTCSDNLIAGQKIDQSATQGAALALEQCVARYYPIFDESFLALEPLVALEGMGKSHTPEEYRDFILDSLEGSEELIEACLSILAEQVKQVCAFDSASDFSESIDVPDVPEWDEAARRVAKVIDSCSYEPETRTIVIHRPRLLDWLETSGNNDRTLTIMGMFLSGQTLEACAQEVGLTRERIRQIVSRILREVPLVEENRYRYFFETYNPSKDDFLSITGEPISTYTYLHATEHSAMGHRLTYESALNDNRLPQHVRDGIRKILDKGYIYADGCRILESKEAIITHLVMRHASTILIKVEKLWKLYNQFLEDNSLSGVKKLRFATMRNFEASVDRYEQILKLPHSTETKYGGSVRYYDAPAMDFSPLIKLLSSGIVEDVECSASMLMNHPDFNDVLEELDIQNGYELHYILSRYCSDVDGMKVGRSPNVTFGKGSRNDQVLEMIKELSPISAPDLADAYSERYGVDPASFMASYLSTFKIYLKHGKYVYNDQDLNEEQITFVRDQLEGTGRDYLSVSLLKARFKNRFPRASTSLINGDNIAQFGYHPSATLLVKDGIDERAMFSSLLDSKQRFSISDDEFGKDVFDNPSFQAELAIRVRACKLVEFEKDSYLASSVFSSQYVSIDETDLRDYVDSAIEFMKPNTPYTVKSLVSSGFTHKIDVLRNDFGLDDFFFASLLKSGTVGGRLKTTSVGDTPVFCKTFYNYSAPIMVEQIVAKVEAIEIDDLAYLLEDDYGIQASNSLLRSIVKRSDLYFNETLDMVFDSKETYRRKAQEWIS